jgi:biotin carboxyl carrier protein
MPYEVKLNDRTAVVELLSRQGKKILVSVDGREYELDVERVGSGKLSILHRHKSFNIELIQGENAKRYHVNTKTKAYDVDIIDAEAKYLASRKKGQAEEGDASIVAPIPGKVVRVMVEKGDAVEAGQTLVVLSAMKMESEFKAGKAGKVIDLRVEAGQTVEARQVMVVLEYESQAQ